MAIQTFTSGQTLTATQMNNLQANDYNLTTTTQTGNYTLVVGDRGTREIANSASAITFTVPANVFTAGDIVQVHNIGAGVLTLAAGAGMTLTSGDGLRVIQWQGGTIFFTSATAAIFFPTNIGLQTKLITSTRDLTAASGNVSYTGVGFTPTAIHNISYVTASLGSLGYADSARADTGIKLNVTATYESGFIYLETTSNNYQTATIASYDSDGFTLTWTKVNSPTGTLQLSFLCMR